jgi:hypothetical protein
MQQNYGYPGIEIQHSSPEWWDVSQLSRLDLPAVGHWALSQKEHDLKRRIDVPVIDDAGRSCQVAYRPKSFMGS